MKILITGSSGFIGTNLMNYYLNQANISICGIDIREPKVFEHNSLWKKVDILDFDNLEKIVCEFAPDYIIHLAARTDIQGKNINDYPANTKGVKNIIKVSRNIPNLLRVIFTSSMLVCKVGYRPNGPDDYCPPNAYGESKVATENIVKELCQSSLFSWCIIRPASIWGPFFSAPYKTFFEMVKNNRFLDIGEKSCIKTYGYIGNSVYQIDKLLYEKTTNINKQIFYIGDNPPIHISKWAHEIAQEFNSKVYKSPFFILILLGLAGDLLKIIKVNFPMNSFRLNNMTTDNVVDLENTYRIALSPPYNRLEGIRETIHWLSEQ